MHRTSLIMQTYEKDQKQPSSHSRTDMSKTQIFPVSIVDVDTKNITYLKNSKFHFSQAVLLKSFVF